MSAMDKVKNDEHVAAPTRTIKRMMVGMTEEEKTEKLDALTFAIVKATLVNAKELTEGDGDF